MRALRLAALAALAFVLAAGLAAPALAQVCAVPGSSGPGSITGIVNTYYPGTAATLAAGSTSVAVGSADPRGNATAVAAGDLLLVIQVQDASITTTNSAAYGGSGGGSGYTSLGSSGLYEYVIATGPVSLGSIPIATPLANTYRTAAANATSGQKRYQVIRVPQYSSGTILAGTVTAPPWDGATGGIVAFDVAGNLNWNGQTVDVSGRGFRGGGGQCSNSNGTGTAVANTDYRLAVGAGTINLGGTGSVPDGAKGEGIAGTPILVFSPTVPGSNAAGTVQNTGGVDGTSGGYPAGSFGRGAPGNAGGGGTDGNPGANDQNTGGAGGGNYGIGGKGGFGWTPGTPPGVDAGGFGGMSVPSAANRLFFGGGGGAATTNNCTGTPGNGAASSGAAGGGMVFIRAGTTTGGGTINAAGTAANSTIGNDASGGGGAGGSVLVFVDNSGGAIGASINVQGGAGGSNTGGGSPHGPGGGGSGGFAITSGPATVAIAGGAGGTTATSATSTADYGSASSVGGFQVATLPASQIPGAGSTSACFPQLTATKATTTPFIAAGTPATWTLTVSNLAGRGAATGVTISDTLPASPNITYLSTTSISLAGGATRTAVADPTVGTTTPAWGTFTIPGGGTVTITFQAQTNASVPSGTVQNPGTASYLDPTRTAAQTVTPGGTYTAGGTVGGSNYASGSSTAEDVNVVNPPPAITKSFAPGAINVGATSVLTVSIANASAIALTNVTLTDTYPAGLVNSAAPNGASSCGGTVTAAPAGTGFSLAGASIPAGGSCTITVNVTITATGAYTNTIPIAALGNAQGIVNTAAASATLFSNVTVAKSFSPTAVAPNTDATLSLAITNPNGVALNLANPGLTDPFPANLVATGGAVTVAGAGCTGFAPATVAAGATSLVLTAGTLPANSTCTVSIAVRSAVAGTYNNTSGGVTTVQTGTTGPASNTAGLGVGLINVQKTFSPNTILSGGLTTVTYTLTNPTGVAQTGGTFLDTLINMTVGGTGTVGGTCTGTTPASFAPGATALNFTGITIPAGSCTITVPITSSTVGALPNATNGVTTAALPQGPGSNTDILNVLARPTIAKAFSPATVAPGASSTLTFTLTNTGPIALTGAAFTDTYPAGLVNATPLVVGGTCTGVTHTATAGGTSFAVTGGTIPAASSCTITVAVTAAAAGSYANTSGGVATTQTGAPVAGSNTATLNVAAAPTIAKAFGTSPIAQGGTSIATFTIANANTIALTNVRFTDALVNMSVASPTIGGTCAGTTNTPALVAGATALDLTVPTLAAGASCTITVTLTSSVSGTNPNTTSGVTSTQTPAAGAPSNTANLVVLSPPTIAKNFVPGTIQAGGASAITFTVANPNAAALTNVQWSDALANMALGTGAAVTETCGGTVASAGVAAGSVNFNLTLNTLAAGETCTVTVSPVTSSTVSPPGGHPNTTTAVTSAQTPAGGATATGFLNVVVAPTLTKSFSPNTVTSGTPNSTITFTLTNPNAVALTDIRFTDAFPANMRTRAIAQNFIGAGRGTCTGTIPSAQGAVNQTSLSFTSTTLAPGASCTILVDIEVTANGTYTNTTSGATSDQTPTAGATASDVLTRGIVGVTKSFSPATVAVNGTSTLQFRISNNSGNSRTGLAFTDTFPAGMTAVGGAVTLATVSGTACSGLAPATVTAGATGYNLTGLTIPNGSVCTVSLAVRGTTSGVKSNTVTGTAPSQFAGSTDTATLTVFAPAAIAKAFSPATIPAGGTSTLTFTLTNPNAFAPLTAGAFIDSLANMSIAATQAPGGTCAGTLPASFAAGTTLLPFTGITIPAGGSCTVTVVVTSSTVGTNPNSVPGITTAEGGTGTGTGTVNLTVAGLALTKSFGPTSLAVGLPSTLTITITNAGGVAWSGVGFTDNLPAGLAIASPANVATTCPGGTVTAVPGGTTLAFSGGSLLSSTASCTVQANVTAATAGTRNNAAANFSGLTAGVSAAGANASVTHFAGPALTKAFSPASIAPGGTSTLTFTVTASPGGQAVTGVGFTDSLPAGLVVAPVPAATNNCGGTFAPVAGSGSVTLAGASLAAAPASCTLSVVVTSAVLGTYTNNSTNVSGLGGGLTAATANASLSVVGTSLAKTFTPTTIGRGAASILAFTITNGAGNPAQSGLGFIENLPANVFVDAVPGIANTCGGTVTANPGAGSITLAGGSIPAGTGSCSFSARVTSSFAGSYLNNASRILNAPASMDTSPVNATLTVIENPTVAKSFGAASIPSGGTTTLSIVLANPNGVALTGLAFTDVFPASPGPMTLASGASTNTCGGTLANSGGGALNTGDVGIRLTGGSIAAGGSCTITVNVTASTAGSYTNTLAAGSVTSTNGGASSSPASASLNVYARPTVAKSFGVASMAQGGTTTLAITVTNPNAIALTGLAFTDVFPVAPGPMTLADGTSANTCGGTLTDTGSGALGAGDAGIVLAGGTVPANGSCTVTVNVTAGTAGSYTNTLAAGSVSTTQAGTNAAPASAVLAVLLPPTVAKAFAPASIFPDGTSILTVTLTNPNATAVTGAGFTDNHPAGVVNDHTLPNPTTTCGGTLTAPASGTSFTLAGGTIPASGSCTVSVRVTSNQVGVFTNSTGPVATANAGTGTAATAQLTVVGEIGGTKTFTPATVPVGGTATLTLTLANPNTTTAVTGIAFTDTYPAGLANTAAPGVTNTCGGTVTAAANGTSLALAGGSLAAGASCAITVQVTPTTAGTLVNTTGAVSAANAPPNNGGLSGTLVALARPTVAKNFGAPAIPAGGSTTLDITVSNANAVALTGLAFTDVFPTAPGPMTLASGTSTNTCGGTLTDTASGALGAGDVGIVLTGGTVPANGSCTITVTVTASSPGAHVNTLAAGSVTTTNGGSNASPASSSVTVLARPTVAKSFGAASIASGGTTTLSITVTNANAAALTGLAFTDVFPTAPGPMTLANGTSTNTCGGTLTDTGSGALGTGDAGIVLAGGTVPANGSCTVTVNVTASSAGTYANSLAAGSVTTTNGGSNAAAANASVDVLARPTVAKSFGAATIASGGTTTLSITVTNANATALTGVAFTDVFPTAPGPMTLANGTSTNTCGGTLTDTASGALGTGDVGIVLAGGTVPANGSCTITVNVTASTAGTYTNTLAAGSVATANGGSNVAAANASVDVLARPTVAKSFGAATVGPGGTTTLTVTVTNPNATALTGLAFTDVFPTAPGPMTLANGTNTNTCGGTLTDTASGALGTGDVGIVLSGGSVPANGSCTVTVNVTASTAGTYTNTLAAGSVATANGGSNAAPASANLTVLAAPAVAKAFSPAVVGVGQASTLTITLTNANASPVTGVAFTDTYPAGLANAATPALASTCGGSVTGNAGAGSLALSGGTIPAGGSCTVSVSVVASAAGDLVNSTGAVTTGNAGTGTAASATLTVLASPTAAKAFAPSVIGPGQVSTLTITLANANATAVTGVAFTDTYPAGLANTGTPTVSNTCGGTATATGGGGSLALAGGTIPATGSCSVSVTVTSAAPGSYANTTGPIATTNAGTGTAANATLLVLQAVTVTKAFVAPSIGVNDTSLLTITLANPNATAVTGAAFTDTYPAGLVNAASPAAATTCAAGTATATAGGGSLAFAGGTIPANASCTVTVGVTSAATGSYPNSTGAVTTANAGTAAAGTATLTVLSHPVIAKAFSPAEIPVGGVSTLTLTLSNANGGEAITGAAVTDTYPPGLVNTTPASVATTCGGTASGAAGGNAVTLAGGTIPAGGSCTVTATVTSATANAYTNSIAAGGLTSTNAGSNTALATATLAVLSPLAAAKQFTPASIGTNDLSLLTITFTNPNPTSPVTGVAFTDTYPAGLVNAASPAVSSSCGGTVSATGGGNTLTFSGATVPAGGTCTVTVNVTSAATGLYVNSTGPVTTANAGTTAAVTASLTVLQHLSVAKAFSPNPVGTGAPSTLTITLANPNATPLTGVAFTDTYPAGLVNAATPSGATTCAAGTVGASAGAGTASLAGGVVPANASCTVTVSVTSATPGSYTNTLAAGAVTTANAGASTAPASATLGVFDAATIAKSFAPAAIAADGTSTVTFQLSNANPIPLTGGAFTDTLANMRVNAAGAAGGTCAGAAGNVLTAGQTALAFTGLTVPANGSCTVTVVVTSDTPGANPNTASGVTTNEAPAGAPSNTAILTVAAGAPTIAKAFSPTSIAAAGVSTVTLTLANPNAVALTGGAFTDALANMRVAANQNAGGTCAGAGGNALTAGQTSLAFAGLTVPANGSCTVTFTVTSNTAGSHPNTTSGVSSNEAATGAASNTATLTVNVNAATIAKAFSPASIAYVTGVSTLTFTLANTNAIPLTAGAFSDSLSGMAIAANQAAGGTCAGAAANTFTAGATALAFTGLTIPATGSCTVSVTVSSASVGSHPNVSSGVTTAEAGTGAVSNSATLTVTALAPTIAKSFTPNVIGNSQESTLLVTIGNPNDAPITITGVTDNFIANLVRAATPHEATTCAGGVVTSTATSVTLTGGTIPANATCTFEIHVQGVIPGTALVNTIPAGALVTNIGANTAPATATLTILPAADIRVTKAGPATVASGGAITYTIVVTNAGPDAADASTVSDTVPAGVTGVGASCGTPTGGAACGPVNVAGNAVTSTITTLPSGGSVTFTITGTAPATGTFTNSVIALPPVGTADPDDPGRTGANTNGASATTTVLTVDLQLSKTHAGSFTAGSNGVYTLVVNNTLGAAPSAGVITVTDTLPSGLTFVSATGTTWTCAHAAGVVTCTSSAVIAAGATSANPITLTVAVGPTAVPNVTNAATVSGGGEPAVNNGNNAAADYTVVVPAGSNSFQPDGNLATTPGSSVAYPHTFTAGLAGSVTFTTASAQSPAVPGWTQVVYRDANCNGVLDGAESASPIGAGLPLAAGESLCIVVIDNVPAAAPYGAVNVISVTATFNGTLTYTRTDTTTVAGAGGAGLTLAKSVRNVTLGGAAGTANTARPNDVLEYTVTYTNGGAGALNSIVITDATPAFTTFLSATCTAPLPASLTACSATTQPSVGGTGSIAWTLTGSLAPAASGTVVFTVRVNP